MRGGNARVRLAGAWLAAAAGVAGSVLPAVPASADDDGNDMVTAFVAPGSLTDDGGGYYVIGAEPGTAVTQGIVLRNDRSRAIDAHVEAVDAFTSDATGASYGAPGSTPERTGGWIVVATPVVTLQPGEERRVDFTVRVPEGTGPGQYLAGISASVPLPGSGAAAGAAASGASEPGASEPGASAPGASEPEVAAAGTPSSVPASTNAPNGAGFGITLQGQRLIAVQVDVPGPAAARLAVTGVRATATPDGLALLVGIANEGNAFARGSGTITAAATDLSVEFPIDTFVPGTEIEYRVPWTDDVVTGVHEIAVELRSGDGERVNWNGTLPIDAGRAQELEADLAELRVAGPGGLPLLGVVGAGLAAATGCAAGALVWRRRRHSARPRLAGAVN